MEPYMEGPIIKCFQCLHGFDIRQRDHMEYYEHHRCHETRYVLESGLTVFQGIFELEINLARTDPDLVFAFHSALGQETL